MKESAEKSIFPSRLEKSNLKGRSAYEKVDSLPTNATSSPWL